jgi:hypothetical protein
VHKIWFGVILGLCLVLLTGLVSAIQADVGYVLEDSSQVNSDILSSFSDLGLTHDVIRDSELASTDFSDYSVLVIVEDVDRVDKIPFNDISTMFLDKKIAEEVWNIGSSSFSLTKKIEVDNEDSFVFDELVIPSNDEIIVYPIYAKEIHYLSSVKEPGLEIAAVKSGTSRPIIAYKFKDNGEETIKSLFFGIVDASNWNNNAEQMFENSLSWLIGEVDQDEDGWLFSEDCNDMDPNTYPGASEVPYDGVDQDCNGDDLTDVDGDSFDAEVVGGLDCNDNDDFINPLNPNPMLNCVNDAPVISSAPIYLEYLETQFVVITVVAYDPEKDKLEYSIDDPRFSWDGNAFIWETGFNDEGTYDFVITVSDGDIDTNANVNVKINNMNRPPTLSGDISTVTWDEDSVGAQIDLNDYFLDEDGDGLEFGVEDTSEQTDVSVIINEDGRVDFSSVENFYGEDWVTFFAWDGNEKALTNQVALKVNPVNDPMTFSGNIEDLEWNEDEIFEVAILLENYFDDIDSELEYEVFGNDKIDVVITSGGIVSFYPEKDFFGSEQIYFKAKDGEFTADSNTLTLNVLDMGEPPVFAPLVCNTDLLEDVEDNCILDASDFEGDPFMFSVKKATNMKCNLDGNQLSYVSNKDYNGAASCVLEVADALHGSSTITLQVIISPVNDAPKIISRGPKDNLINVIEGFDREFEVEAKDIDSEVNIDWIVNGDIVLENSNKFTYHSTSPGTFFLEARVSDEEFEESTYWTVIVGALGEFECSEVGGSVCSGSFVCSEPTFGMKDTNVCCLAECIPEFKDVNECDEINGELEVFIDNPNADEDLELGELFDVDLEIINNYFEDQKFDVEVHLYNVDEGESIEEVNDEIKIKDGKSEELTIELRIPEDLDVDDDYYLFVKVEDNVCNQAQVPVDLIRADNHVVISEFMSPSNVICGEFVDVAIRVDNMGTQDQDVTVFLESFDLDVYEISEGFELEEYDKDDRETIEFSFFIPEDVETGDYEFEATALYGADVDVYTKQIFVECKETKEIVSGSEALSFITAEREIILNSAELEVGEIPKGPNLMLLAWVIMADFLLVGAIGILYLAWEKSKLR